MFTRLTLLALLVFLAGQPRAQWSLQPGIGIANPVSGYKSISKTGILYQLDIARRLANNRWQVGLMLGWARMHNDNNSSDMFGNARLDQMPIIANADYEFGGNKLIPYAGFGLGVSLYNLSYDISPTSGETVFNVSFSMMPELGLRLKASDHIFPFIEVNAPLVMDGPPLGAGESDKATGYIGVALGFAYRF